MIPLNDQNTMTKLARTGPTFKCAFKLLAPDPLAAAILGSRGAGIQEIQTQTETKISLADRADKFHGTGLRLVLVRGHAVEAMDASLQKIVLKLQSLVDDPKNPDGDLSDVLSKSGEYKLKVVMPKAAAGAMIGRAGGNIRNIREETACKVHVEDTKIGFGDLAEQIISLLGTIDSVAQCLTRLNALVQDCSNSDYFQDWAHLRCNASPSVPAGGKGGLGMGMSAGLFSSSPHGGSLGWNGMPASSGMPGMGYQERGIGQLSVLNQALSLMPAELVTNRTFAVQASLPIDSMSPLIGRGGTHIKEIWTITGAKVTLRDEDPNTVVTIEGPLQSVLAGYCMVMKKYLELEATGGFKVDGVKGGGKDGGKGGGKGKVGN